MSAPSDAAISSPEVIDPNELKEAEQYLGKENLVRMHKPQLMTIKFPPSLIGVSDRRSPQRVQLLLTTRGASADQLFSLCACVASAAAPVWQAAV